MAWWIISVWRSRFGILDNELNVRRCLLRYHIYMWMVRLQHFIFPCIVRSGCTAVSSPFRKFQCFQFAYGYWTPVSWNGIVYMVDNKPTWVAGSRFLHNAILASAAGISNLYWGGGEEASWFFSLVGWYYSIQQIDRFIWVTLCSSRYSKHGRFVNFG